MPAHMRYVTGKSIIHGVIVRSLSELTAFTCDLEFPMNARRRRGTRTTYEQDSGAHISIQRDCLGIKCPENGPPI
eukprot:1600687-Pyramimonas_sp.AAC.1